MSILKIEILFLQEGSGGLHRSVEYVNALCALRRPSSVQSVKTEKQPLERAARRTRWKLFNAKRICSSSDESGTPRHQTSYFSWSGNKMQQQICRIPLPPLCQFHFHSLYVCLLYDYRISNCFSFIIIAIISYFNLQFNLTYKLSLKIWKNYLHKSVSNILMSPSEMKIYLELNGEKLISKNWKDGPKCKKVGFICKLVITVEHSESSPVIFICDLTQIWNQRKKLKI